MLSSTLDRLVCPSCQSQKLELKASKTQKLECGTDDVVSGALKCSRCTAKFPILAGVAVLTENPGEYLVAHVKGVSREVPESEFPKEFRARMARAKAEIESEHIEEDLESERVAALYVMTHYLRASGDWWKPENGKGSPVIEEWIRKYWDHGPFERIRKGVAERAGKEKLSLVELGCGVGGLLRVLSPHLDRYLGVDSSFASIALARRLALGAGAKPSKSAKLKAPGDLLEGSVTRDISNLVQDSVRAKTDMADFVVGDAAAPPLAPGVWDICASLNMIDMLENPEELPAIQKRLVRPKNRQPGGWVVQSSPYIWHPEIARSLRKAFGPLDSAQAVLRLYEAAGLRIEDSDEQVPWLFFKNFRQIELYSVHVLFAALA